MLPAANLCSASVVSFSCAVDLLCGFKRCKETMFFANEKLAFRN